MAVSYTWVLIFAAITSYHACESLHRGIDFLSVEDIAGYNVVEFDGPDLRGIESIAWEMGSACKNDKRKFNLLRDRLHERITGLTENDDKRIDLITYSNHVMMVAKRTNEVLGFDSKSLY